MRKINSSAFSHLVGMAETLLAERVCMFRRFGVDEQRACTLWVSLNGNKEDFLRVNSGLEETLPARSPG